MCLCLCLCVCVLQVIRTLLEQLEELTGAVHEEGEDLRVLLEENGFLRAQIDRVSRVAASAALTRDKEKSASWTKEVPVFFNALVAML